MVVGFSLLHNFRDSLDYLSVEKLVKPGSFFKQAVLEPLHGSCTECARTSSSPAFSSLFTSYITSSWPSTAVSEQLEHFLCCATVGLKET